MSAALKQAIQDEARRLGFILAGVTTPDPPAHLTTFRNWLSQARHASMDYLADERARARRADPKRILPECQSILVLALPYPDPKTVEAPAEGPPRGRIAAYAWGTDYHLVIPEKSRSLMDFIEAQVGHVVTHRIYTDTGPLLERDLAQRAGLGWIGRNTCLIHPRTGSYFLLGEILLGLELEPDEPFATDPCGTCTRCIEACPTRCILPDRTIDAGRCISYLTIELKEDIPPELRPRLGNWVFGCDVCQMVCPWNRFAAPSGDPALAARPGLSLPVLIDELALTPQAFNNKFKGSPVKRAKRRGYLRNTAVALGNSGGSAAVPALITAQTDSEPLVQTHAEWALERLRRETA